MDDNQLNSTIAASTINSTAELPVISENLNLTVSCIYLLIFVVGLIGNGIVLAFFMTRDRTRVRHREGSVANVLIINLAVADFIFVGALPFWATERFLQGEWRFGDWGCKLLSFVSLLNLYGSVYFLVAMSIDRFLAVVYAIQSRNWRTPRNAVFACVIIWLLASLTASQSLFLRQTMSEGGREVCRWQFTPEILDAYFGLRTSLGFFIPFLIIIICYITIIINLRRRSERNSASGVTVINIQHKVTRLVLLVITVFVGCWLPNHVVTLIIASIKDDVVEQNRLRITEAMLLSSIPAYANSCTNPILYAFIKDDLRLAVTRKIRNYFGLTTAPMRAAEEENSQVETVKYRKHLQRSVQSNNPTLSCENETVVSPVIERDFDAGKANGSIRSSKANFLLYENEMRSDEEGSEKSFKIVDASVVDHTGATSI
ncbi:unnamed protein product [Clavelina lepadiformis]|uniref:G-protein coupled receptors family 1 profile domain-containing protein n=1 Tax=Clavelina lepadiformis TaxID=159417 RepID=A0ABP0FSB2_CLALP